MQFQFKPLWLLILVGLVAIAVAATKYQIQQSRTYIIFGEVLFGAPDAMKIASAGEAAIVGGFTPSDSQPMHGLTPNGLTANWLLGGIRYGTRSKFFEKQQAISKVKDAIEDFLHRNPDLAPTKATLTVITHQTGKREAQQITSYKFDDGTWSQIDPLYIQR